MFDGMAQAPRSNVVPTPVREPRRRSALVVAAALLLIAASSPPAPPDLRLSWVDGRGSRPGGSPLRGSPGRTIRLRYQVRNVGGSDAFAVVVSAATALGPIGLPMRFEPGPDAGARIDGVLDLALADGMREVCLEARLQTVRPEDPGDPNPADNRLCRPIEAVVKDSRQRTAATDSRDKEMP